VTAPSPEAISARDGWFDLWFDAFGRADGGPDRAGVWVPGTGGPRVPYVRATERIGGVPVPVVRSATNVHTARYDVLGDAPAGAAFCRDLLREQRASMLVFDHVDASSRLLASLADAPPVLRWHQRLMARSPVVDCTIGFDRWWADRGSHRDTWKRRERRLIDREGGEVEVVRTWADAEAVLDEVLDVEASGWKGGGGTAIKQGADTLRFYTGLVRWCAEEGTLRLYVLRLGGRIVAFQLDTLAGGTLSMLKIGYLDELRKQSPGQVLQLQILRSAFADPEVEVFDMLGGNLHPDDTKLRFATGIEDLYRVRVFAPTPRGALAWSRHVAGPAARAALERRRAARDPDDQGTSR